MRNDELYEKQVKYVYLNPEFLFLLKKLEEENNQQINMMT